jgi:cytosine/adenosine deaminase-related metal-dependent hydrolase
MTAAEKSGDVSVLRGTVVTCRDDPFLSDPAKAFGVETDGIVICRDGLIEAVGPAAELRTRVPTGVAVTDYSGCLIAPGFIDTHVHYVQTGIVASYGTQLLDWLDRYAFPAEMAFEDAAHAAAMAKVFCDELLRNGTTTALVFCAVYPQSVEALFAEAERRGMRIAAGKVLMDRNAPEKLRDRAAGLRRLQGADRTLARPWALSLCHHAALCRHLDAGAARCRGRVMARASGCAGADPHCGKPPRDRMDRRTVSRAEELSRHL